MQNQITFERTLPSDAEALAAIRVEAMRESLERVGRFDPIRAKDRFLSSFSSAHTHHILLHGRKVGFFVLKPGADGLLLDHLYVRPGYQGQGIGAAVLAEVFEQADRVACQVRVGALRESASNRFYERHGFGLVEQTEFDNYYVRHAASAL
jgi:GNAT superfamily N-acetyltransferase